MDAHDHDEHGSQQGHHDHSEGHHDHSEGHHDHSDCQDVIARLYEFVDGELTIERRARIQEHLDACLPCFEAFDFEAELRVVISERCRDSVPQSLRERIAGALDDE